MRVCPKCGENIKTDGDFCPFCSCSLENAIDEGNINKVKKSFVEADYFGLIAETIGTIGLIISILSFLLLQRCYGSSASIYLFTFAWMLAFFAFAGALIALYLSCLGKIKNRYNSKCKTSLIISIIVLVFAMICLGSAVFAVLSWV